MSTRDDGRGMDYPLPNYVRVHGATVGFLREVLRHLPSEAKIAELPPAVRQQLVQVLTLALPAERAKEGARGETWARALQQQTPARAVTVLDHRVSKFGLKDLGL